MKLFDSAAFRKPKRNKFDLSHERKLSMYMGMLTPILCQEVCPGESWKVSTEQMVRFAPLLAPIMHRNNVFIHNFFVPYRLVWDEFQDFITGGRLGTAAPVHPFVKLNNTRKAYFGMGTLADNLGVPIIPSGQTVDAAGEQNISALPFRAYQLIYNDYYRDQNLEPSLFDPTSANYLTKGSGEVTDNIQYGATMALRNRCWEKDYFTSCLPFAQRGAAVTLPMEMDVAVDTIIDKATGLPAIGNVNLANYTAAPGDIAASSDINQKFELTGDSVQVATTINDLRTSIRLQEWLEKNARGGARYIEQILVHFGVLSSDARLQRPEYLGGSRTPVQISEVLSNYQDPDVVDGLPQGSMAGHGISVGHKGGFTRRFEEHGVIISIMSVLPRTAYYQGIPKMFQRFDKLDFLWPEFSNLGEQEVKNKELFYDWTATGATNGSTGNEDTFGYQSRYAEYKYIPSTIHGEFKTSLDHWHMSRQFAIGAKPTLNSQFVRTQDISAIEGRVFAVGGYTQNLWVQVYHHISAIRPLSYHAIPTI